MKQVFSLSLSLDKNWETRQLLPPSTASADQQLFQAVAGVARGGRGEGKQGGGVSTVWRDERNFVSKQTLQPAPKSCASGSNNNYNNNNNNGDFNPFLPVFFFGVLMSEKLRNLQFSWTHYAKVSQRSPESESERERVEAGQWNSF